MGPVQHGGEEGLGPCTTWWDWVLMHSDEDENMSLHLLSYWNHCSGQGPSVSQIISYSKRHLCLLQLLSYALEIGMSVVELQ